MTKKHFLLISIIVIIFPFARLYSQATQDLSISIANIKKSVESITADSTLRKTVLHRNNIPDSTIKNFKTYRNPINRLTAFYSNDTLKRLNIKTYSIYSVETDYFFDNEQLIFILEKYHNNSRMGSCGDIDIENHLYYNLKKLIKMETVEIPFTCYNEKIADEILLTDLANILTFLRIYQTKNIR